MAQVLKVQRLEQTIRVFHASLFKRGLGWEYAETNKRDLRLDFLRGFAVLMMVVDHFGGSSWLYLITGGNTFFTSGAEAFVFISGLVTGLVYGAIALKEGLKAAQIKALRRALTLYKLNLVLTVLFAAFSLHFELPWAKDVQIDNPLRFVLDVIMLRQTMYLTDIPLLNSFLMLLTPVALWLLYKKRTCWLVAGSGMLWMAFHLFTNQMQFPWPIAGNTTFHLAAWQLLFFLAMAVGYHCTRLTEKLNQIPRRPYFVLAGVLLIGLVQFHASNGTMLSQIIPDVDKTDWMTTFFQKSTLAPGRLIASFIVFQFAYLAATLFWKPLSTNLGWIFVPLGQNSLYCYSMHVIVIGLYFALIPHLPINIPAMGTLNTGLQLLVMFLIWSMIRKQFMFGIIPR